MALGRGLGGGDPALRAAGGIRRLAPGRDVARGCGGCAAPRVAAARSRCTIWRSGGGGWRRKWRARYGRPADEAGRRQVGDWGSARTEAHPAAPPLISAEQAAGVVAQVSAPGGLAKKQGAAVRARRPRGDDPARRRPWLVGQADRAALTGPVAGISGCAARAGRAGPAGNFAPDRPPHLAGQRDRPRKFTSPGTTLDGGRERKPAVTARSVDAPHRRLSRL